MPHPRWKLLDEDPHKVPRKGLLFKYYGSVDQRPWIIREDNGYLKPHYDFRDDAILLCLGKYYRAFETGSILEEFYDVTHGGIVLLDYEAGRKLRQAKDS